MAVQTSRGYGQIERSHDAILKSWPHVITTQCCVPINRRLKPIAIIAVKIGSPSVPRANVILKQPFTVETANFKFSRSVKLEPNLPVVHRNSILHGRSAMTKRPRCDALFSRSAG